MANYPEGWAGGLMQAQAFINDQKVSAIEIAKAQNDLNTNQQMVNFANQAIEKKTEDQHGVPPTTMEALGIWAQGAALKGRPLEAVDIIDKISKAETGIATIRAKTYETQMQAAESMAFELAQSNPQDQQQWGDFLNRYSMTHPEIAQNPTTKAQFEQMAKMPYTPELMAQFKGSLANTINTSKLKLEQARTQKLVADTAAEEFKTNVAGPLKAASDKAKLEALTKNGGVKGATKLELAQASALIRKDYLSNNVDAIEVDAANLVDEAKTLSSSSKLTFNQALATAYAKQKGLNTYDKYKARPPTPGLTPATPLELPTTKEYMWSDPVPDPTKMITNRWYRSPSGKVGKWDGRQMIVGEP